MISVPLPSQTVTSLPANPIEPTSQYQAQLHPWCIVRQLPNLQNITVARFRKRNDADAHQRILEQLIPQARFVIMFEPPLPVASRLTQQAEPTPANS